MGKLTERVGKAFEMYKAGDFKGFCHALADAGDVHYMWHKTIVDTAIDDELKKL